MIRMEFPRAELERYANDTDRIYALKRQVDMLINNLQIVLDSIEDDIDIENATTTIYEDSGDTPTPVGTETDPIFTASPDSDNAEPFYELAEEFNLPVVSHTGGCELAMSEHLYRAAEKHPDINFVMVHMDLGTDNRDALEYLGMLPNLYGDTTWVPIKTTVEAIRRYGSKKMLFGTDNPIDGKDTLLTNKTGDRSIYQEYFNELRDMITPDEYDDLMYRNAQKLFGIKM